MNKKNKNHSYIVLKSKDIVPSFHQRKEVILIINDFFHNFLEFVNYYKSILKVIPNKKIILFNYPGQVFTIYNEEIIHNNQLISKIIDCMIYFLDNIDTIDLSQEKLKIIGYGYGGNIASYFVSSTEGALSSLISLLLINSFTYVDKMLFSALNNCINNFEVVLANLPELAYDFFWNLTCTLEIDKNKVKKMMETNPISNKSRSYIIKGNYNFIYHFVVKFNY